MNDFNVVEFGYMKRRIRRLEEEQSLLGQRIMELEARLRAENTGSIPGDIGLDVDEFVLKYRGTTDATPGSETETILLEARYDDVSRGRDIHADIRENWNAFRMLPPEQGDEHR